MVPEGRESDHGALKTDQPTPIKIQNDPSPRGGMTTIVASNRDMQNRAIALEC
jgi:hypothetical protein